MDYPDYYWLNSDSRDFLSKGYLQDGQMAEERIVAIARNSERLNGIEGFADKFESYVKRGFYSLSTPVLSNFGTDRGLPVSCFGSYIDDDIDAILAKNTEVGKMTKVGGGTSAYFGALRPRGSKISKGGEADGPVRFMELFEKTTTVISQGNTRRGAFAAYLPVDHPDIVEFLDSIREEKSPLKKIYFGVCVSDQWMQEMIDGDEEKQDIWAHVLEKRSTGFPYIFFSDNANNNKPQVYKNKNISIHASNLCSEIMLSSGLDHSFVCVLASINLLHWDKIVETDAIETLVYFLDTVTEEFIQKSKDVPGLEAAHKFAFTQRAIGVGVLGWHSLLQSKMIPFESMEAKLLNTKIFRTLNERTLKASKELAIRFGEPEMLKGYGERMVTRMAVAPTTSSSFIFGQVSPSIEPLDTNYFNKDLAKGIYPWRNPFLKEVLQQYGEDDEETWSDILLHGGSVQHLDFLTQLQKDVFKTFSEISPKEVVIQAAARQKYIDQSQSLNLKIPIDAKVRDINALYIEGWKLGIKSFYYQIGSNPAQQLARDILTCKSCEA
jgi:ribonucleoside-diphosphate reductase alpha chain